MTDAAHAGGPDARGDSALAERVLFRGIARQGEIDFQLPGLDDGEVGSLEKSDWLLLPGLAEDDAIGGKLPLEVRECLFSPGRSCAAERRMSGWTADCPGCAEQGRDVRAATGRPT